MDTKTPSVLKRVLWIVAASSVVLAFAVYQGRAIVPRSQSAVRVPSGARIVEPVSGSQFLRSYPVVFNGRTTDFGHYASRRTAEQVIQEFARRHESSSAPMPPCSRAPTLVSAGSGCSTFSYATKGGTTIGIVAYDNRDTGGSDYFVGAMAAAASPPPAGADCPGREPPGVPKPLRGTRTLCIENLGGVSSVLNTYEVWGRPSEMVEDLREGMTANRWAERTESSAVLTRNYEGSALLSFSRGHEQCLVAVDRAPQSGKIVVLIFWAERRWLPKGVAL